MKHNLVETGWFLLSRLPCISSASTLPSSPPRAVTNNVCFDGGKYPPGQEMIHHRLAADIMTGFVDEELLPPRSQGAHGILYSSAMSVVFLLPSRGGGGKDQGDGPMGCGHATSKDEAFFHGTEDADPSLVPGHGDPRGGRS